MEAPISSSSKGAMAFTVPWVPTGMKTGVLISPLGVEIRPARAPVTGQTPSSVKEKGDAEGQSFMETRPFREVVIPAEEPLGIPTDLEGHG